jgi:hypothetical protein
MNPVKIMYTLEALEHAHVRTEATTGDIWRLQAPAIVRIIQR